MNKYVLQKETRFVYYRVIYSFLNTSNYHNLFFDQKIVPVEERYTGSESLQVWI